MSSQFQLSRYEIESIAVTPNNKYNSELKSHTGDVTSTLHVAGHKTDPKKFIVVLELLVHPTKGRESKFYPYNIAIKGRGHFVFKDKPETDIAARILNVNGASILYGLLRGQITQITAQSVRGQFILPPLNFVEMFDSRKTTNKPRQKESLNLPKG